ncbi:thymidylate kinase-like protein [Halteromyces radiatus]|uniref:thymidylate kinase-like protein n=1 Tax=Halteromyces radiatus TaxID=101107 RepID=UPI002220A5B3|nr:thymidylate kinase-like protein [Halteromyces radiatus]KAI8089594.1 thymidylate kinase-like protein [Halteromyces radiatus]
MRGHLIVIEGCDRSGKSTQCERLVTTLQQQGRKTQLFKFPDRTTQTGKMIDSYLKQSTHMDDHAIHLLFSANRWEAMSHMTSLLEQGTTIIVDRYAFSGVCFSAAKGLDFEWCRQPDVGLLTPDVVMFMDLSMDEAEKRGGFGEERYEKRELQLKVRQEFQKMMDSSWKIIDASKSKDQVYNDMMAVIKSLDSNPGPLKQDLWK